MDQPDIFVGDLVNLISGYCAGHRISRQISDQTLDTRPVLYRIPDIQQYSYDIRPDRKIINPKLNKTYD